MLMLPLVYWCIDRDAGRRLIVFFLVSVISIRSPKRFLISLDRLTMTPGFARLSMRVGEGCPADIRRERW